MYSTGVVISNLTFTNSPFWAIHPVYCSYVHIKNVTILAPPDSPNTDGIDPEDEEEAGVDTYYGATLDEMLDLDHQQAPLAVDDTPLD
ncbi:putative polygalacturonase [Iris pallida]|uniref:Polygalacturonase n=1 Tax=Iris pallida TaxID=29817 RepID=A0AAX6DWX8_IRIPA|nr:putative polygalacturonase [Iris pallida]